MEGPQIAQVLYLCTVRIPTAASSHYHNRAWGRPSRRLPMVPMIPHGCIVAVAVAAAQALVKMETHLALEDPQGVVMKASMRTTHQINPLPLLQS